MAQTLISEGHLSTEQPLPLRIKGEVRDIRLFSSSVDDEPHPSSLPKRHLEKWNRPSAIRSGNYSVAIDKLTTLLKQFPRYPQILRNLAATHFALKHNDQGEALLRQALA